MGAAGTFPFGQPVLPLAQSIIDDIELPPGVGSLVPAGEHLNGPSGKALDDLYLAPLGLSRGEAWLCATSCRIAA